jgi:formate C-acetyltransferase
MSSMVADCLERGREMHDGGARYHDYGIAPLGIPNAGDALYAVKRAVYEDGLCSAAELLAALETNFAGQEALRLQLRSLPKFGQQRPDADGMTSRVLATVCGIYSDYRTRWGGRVKPMVFTFVWGPPTGAALGATADGQFAGKPIAHGLTPQNSSMTEGITAAIRSHTSLCLDRVAGASTTMWDLDPLWATPDTTKAILKTFLRLGGQIYQGNTTDVGELVRAKERPHEYPHLFVRVGGFSARFVTLDAALQDEIIHRHRHRE